MFVQLLFGLAHRRPRGGVGAARGSTACSSARACSASARRRSSSRSLLQYVFARGLGWLPLDGFGKTTGEHARCLVLPALTLGIYGAAYYTRLVRDEMAVLLQQDWVRTARAKGLSARARRPVARRCATRCVPIVTAVGLDFGALMGGAVVTETVFRWPGLGDLSVKALLDRDGPIILACVVVSRSVAIVAANVRRRRALRAPRSARCVRGEARRGVLCLPSKRHSFTFAECACATQLGRRRAPRAPLPDAW